MYDVDYQEGLIRDEPQPRIVGGSGMGCYGKYALMLLAVPIGLVLGTVIMLLVFLAPWVYPVGMVLYFVWRSRAAVTSYSRGRTRQGP